jgi:hypothetical protein
LFINCQKPDDVNPTGGSQEGDYPCYPEIRGEISLEAAGRAAKEAYFVPYGVFPANYISLYFAVFTVFP